MPITTARQIIEQTTGYLFKDKKIFEECITKSDEIQGNRTEFQRMEFLEDKVLNLAVSHLCT